MVVPVWPGDEVERCVGCGLVGDVMDAEVAAEDASD